MAHRDDAARSTRGPLIVAGVLLGLGLGGFADGIVLHQLLQWHHMLTSAGYPPDSVENLKVNTTWDGLFHATTYIFVAAGLVVLWRAGRIEHPRWSWRLLPATLLIGFGIFNLIEGLVNHQIHWSRGTVSLTWWIPRTW